MHASFTLSNGHAEQYFNILFNRLKIYHVNLGEIFMVYVGIARRIYELKFIWLNTLGFYCRHNPTDSVCCGNQPVKSGFRPHMRK